jgi:hypothetical protein
MVESSQLGDGPGEEILVPAASEILWSLGARQMPWFYLEQGEARQLLGHRCVRRWLSGSVLHPCGPEREDSLPHQPTSIWWALTRLWVKGWLSLSKSHFTDGDVEDRNSKLFPKSSKWDGPGGSQRLIPEINGHQTFPLYTALWRNLWTSIPIYPLKNMFIYNCTVSFIYLFGGWGLDPGPCTG